MHMSNSPFPGMDPYLEHPSLWQDVHNRLITAIADKISPVVAPNYYVGVESRTYVILPEGDQLLGRPDVSIISPTPITPVTTPSTQTLETDGVTVVDVQLLQQDEINHYYLEIRGVKNHELITAIEILSPANKINQSGRSSYMKKRTEITSSRTNLVEIDLLRAGEPLPLATPFASDYRILVSRSWTRTNAKLYAFNLQAPIPDFPVPLQRTDDEPIVNLNQILHDLYGRARFDLRIDYTQPPVPPLTEKQAEWASQLLSS